MSLSRLVVGLLCASAPLAAAEPIAEIRVDPATVHLAGPDSRYSLLVTGTRPDGRLVDLTADARLVPADGELVRADGQTLRGRKDGTTTVRVEVGGRAVAVPVQVTGAGTPRRYHFENDSSAVTTNPDTRAVVARLVAADRQDVSYADLLATCGLPEAALRTELLKNAIGEG